MKKELNYLALGDSYTVGQSVQLEECFPILLQSALNKEGLKFKQPIIVAETGWTTGNLKAAINNSSPPKDTFDLITLLIGVNNQYQGQSIDQYKIELNELIQKSINFAGGAKDHVIVLSIPDYGYTPFGKNSQVRISEQIARFNAVNKCVADSAGLSYLNITPISQQGLNDPTLVANDGLHPSGKMYAQWVELMLPEVLKKLK